MHSDQRAFPSVAQAALLLLAWFLLRYVLTLALYDLRLWLGITPEHIDALATVLANGVLITAAMHIRKLSHRDLIHPSTNSALSTFVFLVPPVLLLIPLTLLLDYSLIGLLEALFPLSAWEQQAFEGMATGTLTTVVSVCLIAPVVEEMLFRGILLRAFLERYPRGLAIAYSALFFGAAHLNIYQFVLAFGLGLLLGWLYERSRSLVPCIALHAALNSTVIALELAAPQSAAFDPWAVPALGWLGAVLAASLGMLALRRVLAPAHRSPPL